MTDRPSFRNPPVSEVSCSLQFDSALPVSALDLGKVARHFEDRYPNVEEHAPLGPIPRGRARFAFQFGSEIQLPRIFFIDNTETQLVQFQRDRFGVNWRRMSDDEEYPRYEKVIRPSLLDACSRLETALSDLKLDLPVIGAIEVTYTNPIRLPDDVGVEAVLRPWSGLVGPELRSAPRSVNVQITYDIPEIEGTLTIDAGTATRNADGKPFALMNLVVRAEVDGSLNRAIERVDIARDWIVFGFAALTTEQMHDRWGRSP